MFDAARVIMIQEDLCLFLVMVGTDVRKRVPLAHTDHIDIDIQ